MEQRSFVFPAATALGLTDALDEDDVMWDALFKDSPSHAGHDDTSQAAGSDRLIFPEVCPGRALYAVISQYL